MPSKFLLRVPNSIRRCRCHVASEQHLEQGSDKGAERAAACLAFWRLRVTRFQVALSWLLLGNIFHFCSLWFSEKSPLNCYFFFLLPFQPQPSQSRHCWGPPYFDTYRKKRKVRNAGPFWVFESFWVSLVPWTGGWVNEASGMLPGEKPCKLSRSQNPFCG